MNQSDPRVSTYVVVVDRDEVDRTASGIPSVQPWNLNLDANGNPTGDTTGTPASDYWQGRIDAILGCVPVMTLRSLENHNAVRIEAHADDLSSKPTGIACPADNCTGELHCPPPFSEFEPEDGGAASACCHGLPRSVNTRDLPTSSRAQARMV